MRSRWATMRLMPYSRTLGPLLRSSMHLPLLKSSVKPRRMSSLLSPMQGGSNSLATFSAKKLRRARLSVARTRGTPATRTSPRR
jgi:hypothetical protein